MTGRAVDASPASSSADRRRIAVGFLARGAGNDWAASFRRFLDSYREHPAGAEHSLHVLLKGFRSDEAAAQATELFDGIADRVLVLDDDRLDIGAYIDWARQIDEEFICAFNTNSEILSDHWLRKLASNLALPGVGMVGATASYESLNDWNDSFPEFPNVHVRSNAFMLERRLFTRYTDGMEIRNKLDAFNFESGPNSLSRFVESTGQQIMVVGRDGIGYGSRYWPDSDTFRLRFQRNLLVGDNQTRSYLRARWSEKRDIIIRTWGRYLRDFETLGRVAGGG